MTAADLCAPSGLMTLLRIIGGAMHKVGSAMFWARLVLTGSGAQKQDALRAAFLAGMGDLVASCKAEMDAKALLRRGISAEEDNDHAVHLLWIAVGDLVINDDERAYFRAVMAWERTQLQDLRLRVYPPARALHAARAKACCVGWRRFMAALRLLSLLLSLIHI